MKPKKILTSGVVILRRNRKGLRVLLLKRKDGRWDLAKGRRDNKEGAYKAACREAYEETGLSIKVSKICWLVPCKKFCAYLGFTSKKHLSLTEHVDYRWVSRKRALKLLKSSPHLASAVKKLTRKRVLASLAS
jgi:8-oxo-dGTP pyrophosphatase MutT (NUDIX family)